MYGVQSSRTVDASTRRSPKCRTLALGVSGLRLSAPSLSLFLFFSSASSSKGDKQGGYIL